MNSFKKNIYKLESDNLLPLTEFSYVRDGTQNCAGFHIPSVDYINEFGSPQTAYFDECADICEPIYVYSIITEHYVTPC